MHKTEEQRARAREYYRQPFSGGDVPGEFRMTNAVEYIAAALGRISATLEQIDARLEKQEQSGASGKTQSQLDLEHSKRLLDEM